MESGVTYNSKTQSCYCPDCMDTIEIRKKVYLDPEALLHELELIRLDHSECPLFKDVKRARQAREHRKTAKRLALTKAKQNPMTSAGSFRA